MKRERRNEKLISAYIDGTLSDKEKRYVEDVLLTDTAWRKRYEQTRLLKLKLGSLPPQSGKRSLWPALANRIRESDSVKPERIEVVPARLVPVITVLAMIVVGLGSFVLTRNWYDVTEYFRDKLSVVEDIYEQGFVQGALQPLFAGLSNDDLIRFGFSGVLSIPDGEGRGIKVESDSADQFELALTDAEQARNAPSLSQLYSNLNVTPEQQVAIDSVLTNYREFLETSAFIVDRDEVVLSPELAGMDKFIIAAVAQQLLPRQRTSFNDLLSIYAPHIHVPEEIPLPSSPDSKTRSFIVMKQDTVVTAEMQLPEMREFAQLRDGLAAARTAMHKEISEAMKDMRIVIHPTVVTSSDGVHVQVSTRIDRPGVTVTVQKQHPAIRQDSITIPEFQPDYFLRLKELSAALQRRSHVLNGHLPGMIDVDTIEANLRRMEYELERLLPDTLAGP